MQVRLLVLSWTYFERCLPKGQRTQKGMTTVPLLQSGVRPSLATGVICPWRSWASEGARGSNSHPIREVPTSERHGYEAKPGLRGG